MRRLIAGAIAVAAVAAGIWAAQTWAAQKSKAGAADTDQAVLSADQSLRRALAGGDKIAANILLDRRFAHTDRTGRSLAKPLVVLDPASFAGAADAEDVKVRRYGRIAVVTGTSGLSAKGGTFFVHVWLKRRPGWRALAYHDNPIGTETAPLAGVSPAAPAACDNPCKRVPYQPKTPAEQDIVAAFQAIETAVTSNDAEAWTRHIADEFVVYRSNSTPRVKADRVAFIEKQKESGTPTRVGELTAMQLFVFGDSALMTANHAYADGQRPAYRVTRLWVRRDGRWQMALSQQTTIEPVTAAVTTPRP